MLAKHPDCCFFLLGGFGEWERRFARLDNIVIPRAHGLGLGEELALLFQSHLFMGTNSGFANAAAFSETPHVITSIEPAHAKHAQIAPGERHHPFARDNQILCWERETEDNLYRWCQEILAMEN